MLAFRSVQQGNHCAREEFLYELKAGPAGGRTHRQRSDTDLKTQVHIACRHPTPNTPIL
jgi:hypothetical protein